MPTIADMLAVGQEIGFEGKVYPLREPTVLEMGKFQRWLEQQAKDAARRDTEQSPEELAAQLNTINQEAAVGEYEWGGELACKALSRIGPITQLLYIVLSTDHPEVTPDLCRRMMDRNVREIVAGLACKAISDPFAVRAVLVSLGLPEDFLASLTPAPAGDSPSATSPTGSAGGGSDSAA